MIIQPLLSVRDVTASLTFYTEQLGFTPNGTLLPGPDGRPVFAGVKYGPTTLWLDNTEYDELPPYTPLGVGVDLYVTLADDVDIEALYSRLKANGVTIIQELRQQFWGDKRFVIHDPDGYRLSIAQNVRAISNEEMSKHTSRNEP